jgi:DNA polymerase-3 subunit gamma/tau
LSYQVIARRYRPQKFADLVGQEAVALTLRNAVSQGRTAHAYLFTGPRGVGKTSAARILAKALRCEQLTKEGEPCGSCASCKSIADGSSLDVIEIDAASNTGVDNIRELRENVGYSASSGRYRVYIIDEVHMLSTAAFNALLKTLEEPPPHVVFIFATTELHKVLPTILSRCQRFDFRKVPADDMVASLKVICEKENIAVDEASLRTIAIESEGCLRDAQSLLDQAIAFCGGEITADRLEKALGLLDRASFLKLAEYLGDHDAGGALKIVTRAIDKGNDPKVLVNRLVELLSDLHYRAFTKESRRPDPELDAALDSLASKLSSDEIVRALDLALRAQSGLQGAISPAVAAESLVVKLCLQRPAFASAVAASSPVTSPAPALATPSSFSSPSRFSAPTPAPTPSARTAPSAPVAPATPAPASSAAPIAPVSGGGTAALENFIRSQKPAWTPVLGSVLAITVTDGIVQARARADFAGKRLASNDGLEVLKSAYGAGKAVVVLEDSSAPGAPKEDPIQKKKTLAREHEAVLAAVKILDASITETRVLDGDPKAGGPRPRRGDG